MKTILLRSSILLSLFWGVSIEAKLSWAKPEVLSESGREVSVVLDEQKRGVAIWAQDEGEGKMSIASSFYADGWQEMRTISLSAVHHVESPRIAYHSSGQGIAIWNRDHRRGKGIRTASTSNTVWFGFSSIYRAPQEVTAMTDLQVAFNEDGQGVATWVNHYIGRDVLMTALYSGGKWSTPEARTPQLQAIFNVEVAMDAQGRAILVWNEYDWEKMCVKGAVREKDGQPWSDGIVLTGSEQDAEKPHLAVNNQGETMVVWISRERTTIQTVSYADGHWSEPAELLSKKDGNITDVSLTLNNRGNALLTWASNLQVYGMRKWDNTWGAPTLLSQKGWTLYTSQKVLLNDAENGLVVFDAVEDTEGSPFNPENWGRIASFAAEFSQEVWGTPVELFSGSQWTPDVSLSHDNQVCVVASNGQKVEAQLGKFE